MSSGTRRLAVAFIATLWMGPLAHSSNEIQAQRPKGSDSSQGLLPPANVCEPLLKGAARDFPEYKWLGPPLSSNSEKPSVQNLGASMGQNAAQVLVSVGKRVQEIEIQMASVLSLTRQLGEFIENEKAIRASVASEISVLKKVRESFGKSGGLDKADQMLAAALERQKELIRPFESLKAAVEFLDDWRQSPESMGLVKDARQELEQQSQRAVGTGRGGAHHAKIMNLLRLFGRFEDMVFASNWDLTKKNISDSQDLFVSLWNYQTLAVLGASKHTDRFSDFPKNQAIAEGIENLYPTRGDLGRDPVDEMVVVKSIYGYDLLYVAEKLEKMSKSRGIFQMGKAKRKNVALLDPNLSIEGLSRGTVLYSKKSRLFKGHPLAVLGFFPNGDVLVQTLPGPGVLPSVKTISFAQAKRMKDVANSSINRMPLLGDLIYQPTEREVAEGKVSLKLRDQYCGIDSLYLRRIYAQRGIIGRLYALMILPSAVACPVAAVGTLIGAIVGQPDLFAAWLGLLGASSVNLLAQDILAAGYARPRISFGKRNHVQHSATLAELPTSDAESLLVRSDALWIGSNSLTTDERQALEMADGEEWLVSPSGQKLRIDP